MVCSKVTGAAEKREEGQDTYGIAGGAQRTQYTAPWWSYRLRKDEFVVHRNTLDPQTAVNSEEVITLTHKVIKIRIFSFNLNLNNW